MAAVRGPGERVDVSPEEFVAALDAAAAPGDAWETHVQPRIDVVLKRIFESVASTISLEPAHPSGQAMHPNSGRCVLC